MIGHVPMPFLRMTSKKITWGLRMCSRLQAYESMIWKSSSRRNCRPFDLNRDPKQNECTRAASTIPSLPSYKLTITIAQQKHCFIEPIHCTWEYLPAGPWSNNRETEIWEKKLISLIIFSLHYSFLHQNWGKRADLIRSSKDISRGQNLISKSYFYTRKGKNMEREGLIKMQQLEEGAIEKLLGRNSEVKSSWYRP